jgi:DNA repair protein RecO (recombination protein O)
MAASRSSGTEIVVSALLLRSSPMGEADAMVSLFTPELGRIEAFAPSARRPTKTKRLFLEPLHTLRVGLQERAGRDLPSVRSATVLAPRTGLLSSLDGMESAGQMLRWVRASLPTRQPEPEAWELLVGAFDELTQVSGPAVRTLAAFGLRFLSVLGYQLELSQCIRCGKVCPPERAAFLDPAAGGARCAACGGGPFLANGERRRVVRTLAETGDASALSVDDAAEIVAWVAAAYDGHAGTGRFAKVRR